MSWNFFGVEFYIMKSTSMLLSNWPWRSSLCESTKFILKFINLNG